MKILVKHLKKKEDHAFIPKLTPKNYIYFKPFGKLYYIKKPWFNVSKKNYSVKPFFNFDKKPPVINDLVPVYNDRKRQLIYYKFFYYSMLNNNKNYLNNNKNYKKIYNIIYFYLNKNLEPMINNNYLALLNFLKNFNKRIKLNIYSKKKIKLNSFFCNNFLNWFIMFFSHYSLLTINLFLLFDLI